MKLAADRCPGNGGRALLSSLHKQSAPSRLAPRYIAHTLAEPAQKARLLPRSHSPYGACRIACACSIFPQGTDRRQPSLTGYRRTSQFAVATSVPPPGLATTAQLSSALESTDVGLAKATEKSTPNSTLPLWLDCDAGPERGLYATLGVPDTPEGRFEIIALHLVLVLRRLAREGELGSRARAGLDGSIRCGPR